MINCCRSALFIILVSVVFSLFGQGPSKSESFMDDFKIMKITKVHHGFAITVHNDKTDRWFDVASLRKIIKHGNKLVIGKTYRMRLIPCYSEDHIPSLGTIMDCKIDNVELFIPSNEWTGNVYTTPNLKGLFT